MPWHSLTHKKNRQQRTLSLIFAIAWILTQYLCQSHNNYIIFYAGKYFGSSFPCPSSCFRPRAYTVVRKKQLHRCEVRKSIPRWVTQGRIPGQQRGQREQILLFSLLCTDHSAPSQPHRASGLWTTAAIYVSPTEAKLQSKDFWVQSHWLRTQSRGSLIHSFCGKNAV